MIYEVAPVWSTNGLNGHWEYNVEAIGSDGECYVTVFTGPDAEARAHTYASLMNNQADAEIAHNMIDMGFTAHFSGSIPSLEEQTNPMAEQLTELEEFLGAKCPYCKADEEPKPQTYSMEEMAERNPWFKDSMERSDRKMRGELRPSDNPHKTIHIDVDNYWGTEDTALSFLQQFLSGYVWACLHDSSFIAVHQELEECRRLLDRVSAYIGRQKAGDDAEAIYGERFVPWCFVELATILPSMWD